MRIFILVVINLTFFITPACTHYQLNEFCETSWFCDFTNILFFVSSNVRLWHKAVVTSAASGLASSAQPAFWMPREGCSWFHISFCSRTAPVARRSRPHTRISHRTHHALPDAVKAAVFPAHRTRTVEDERMLQPHYPQRHPHFSYSTHLSATAVPALRAGRPRLFSIGTRFYMSSNRAG